MKNLYISLSFALISSTALMAQNKHTQKADKLFSQLNYVDASKEYLKLVDKEADKNYIYKQLAECNYKMGNTAEAAKWYGKLVAKPQDDAEVYFRYAQVLKTNGKNEEANKQMQAFAAKAPNDQRAISYNQDPNYLSKLENKPKSFNVKPLKINSDRTDFAPFLANDNNLYFVTARDNSSKKDGYKDEPFLDIYKVTMGADGTLGKPNPVSELNTKWHEGPVTITADGKTMYFTRDSQADKKFVKDKKLNVKMGQVNLYRAENFSGKWGEITPVPFNGLDFSTSSPSISKDGTTLYFTSNRPGGMGGNDIWKVAVNKDKTYGTPENMGPKVNTAGSEQFPFISDDSILYFSSNGRQGLGGLDVFSIDMNKPDAEAVNLGKPVNTNKDDFSFSFNKTRNVAFFASNRGGNDDIYQADPFCNVEAIVNVTDAKTGALLADAKVSVLMEVAKEKKGKKVSKKDKQSAVETKTTGEDGLANFTVDCDKAYTVSVSKEGYESGVFTIEKTPTGEVKLPAPLKPIDVVVLADRIELKEIRFDYNKWDITPDGAAELDKLVQVMEENEDLVIMVKSHTDTKGKADYNMKLSEKRAKSTVAYIISKGIPANRISGKGYGESEPKIDCKEKCTPEEDAQNRRSEFLIVK